MLKDPFVNEYVMAEKEEVSNLDSLGTFEIARRSGLPKQAKTLKCKCKNIGGASHNWAYAQDAGGRAAFTESGTEATIKT